MNFDQSFPYYFLRSVYYSIIDIIMNILLLIMSKYIVIYYYSPNLYSNAQHELTKTLDIRHMGINLITPCELKKEPEKLIIVTSKMYSSRTFQRNSKKL